ncbi:AmmeMemoRadiSam system protein B [Desulfocurvus vexinensis]|uniref:AmmeMemoRadiSam system protein B n=1 Tax=Desulfocurvus vexinensis TaxID=399548 RepID=UPI000490978A|nr:AmmeMemoRadiSam system protein B [Desulfocurvus vexinensis]
MDRPPVVAGQFYTADPRALGLEVASYLALAEEPESAPTLLAMVPHAGYVFSGPVAGRTLGEARLAPLVVLLGPNHTGLGQPLAVWPSGRWAVPGGGLEVDAELASALLRAEPRLAADTSAHQREHSLEVLVPFLERKDPRTTIVPVAVAEHRYAELEAVAASLAGVLGALGRPASLVVSSDMSHFLPDSQARRVDARALEPVLALDPRGLYDTVRSQGISMCGVLPMTLGLLAARALGATSARLAAYATSAAASGDASRVVGYAGVLVR